MTVLWGTMKACYLAGMVLVLTICAALESELYSEIGSPLTVNKPPPHRLVLNRVAEAKENAFSLLVPEGWITDGGIFRVNPLSQGGPAQSIAAKVDFAVKNNQAGEIMIRWLPDMLFFDARYSPAGQMGLFPPGSNYQGMPVYPLHNAQRYLIDIVIPQTRSNAMDIEVIESKPLPKISAKYQERVHGALPYLSFSYDAALVTLTYREGGVGFTEKWFAIVENWGQMGAGMWGNKETCYLRAPTDRFKEYEPVFSLIQSSVRINRKWLGGEIRGQVQRGEIMLQTQNEIRNIERQIVSHRQLTNAEIHNDMFLTLTDQEEYINPYNNEVEMGSNQWRFRWVNEGGDVLYTDDEYYNPNTDINLQRSDYKRTPVRQRFPN